MKNINLNPGGVIGAIVCFATLVVALLPSGDQLGSRLGGFGIFAILIGALAGNSLWSRVFGKRS